jgi:hypothetical protein
LALYRPIHARLTPPAASHSASSREYRLPAAVPPEAAIPFPETYRINSFYTASAGSCPLQDTGSRANLAKMEYVAAAYSHDVAQRGTVC